MPKNSNRQYLSVSEMLREAAGHEEAITADELSEFMAKRKLVKELALLRCSRHLSQEELGAAIGKTQSWVSKLENSCDDELRIGDVRAYMGAVGLEFRAGAVKKGATCVDEVKHLAFAIRRRLHTLATIARENDEFVERIASFFVETFVHLNKFLGEAAERLPLGPQNKPCISLSLELETLEECDEEGEAVVEPRFRQRIKDCNKEAALN